jgi:hypothetical protein
MEIDTTQKRGWEELNQSIPFNLNLHSINID